MLSGHLYIIFSISSFPKYIFREKCTDLNVGNEWILLRLKAEGAAHTVLQLIELFITGTWVNSSSSVSVGQGEEILEISLTIV